MKKILAALIGLILLLGGNGYAKELKIVEGYTITVPDMAPEFVKWQGAVNGIEKLGDDVILALMVVLNPDRTVYLQVLMIRLDGKAHVIAMAVTYAQSEDTEFLEDIHFMQTGKISGKLDYVQIATDVETLRLRYGKRSF